MTLHRGFPESPLPSTQIILLFSENTQSNQHTFCLGLTLTHLKITKTQQSLHFLIIPTMKVSRCYSAFNALNLIIPTNFLTKSFSQPQVLAVLVPGGDPPDQSPFSVSRESFQTDVQEMGMLLLFSRRVVPPCSWVSGNAVIGLLCCECYMSSHYLSSVKENICSLTNQGSPFPFLSSLACWIFQSSHFWNVLFLVPRETRWRAVLPDKKLAVFLHYRVGLFSLCYICTRGKKKSREVFPIQ